MARCLRCGKVRCVCPAKARPYLFAPDDRILLIIEGLDRRVRALEKKRGAKK